ncbi:MAG: MFS transporter, partial [Pseudomonadota bacterium]|nr:MFS transporter [Pseudomonadota bacterium]
GASQLLPLALMANHSFRLGTLLILIIFGGAMGSMLPMTLFLQQGFDFTPLQAGMTMAPFAAGVLVSSQVVRLFDGYSPRFRMATGALAYAAGMLALRFVISGVEDEIFAPLFSAPLFLSGIGMNLCIATNFQSALFGVPARDAGSGSGTMQAFQHLGSAFGIAIAGQIFFATLDTQFAAGQGRHETYVTALEMALIFNICAFLAVALLSRFIIVPPTGGNTTAPTPAARLEPAD